MTEQAYVDYFENLAKKHKAIQHDPDAGVASFFVATDDNRSEVDKAVRGKLKLPALVLDQYYDDLDRSADNFRLKVLGGFSVLVKCRAMDPKDVRRARDEARLIARSILNKIYADCRLPGGVLQAQRITPMQQAQGEPVPILADIATGWGYPVEWSLPTSVAVDGDDWLP